MVRKVLAQFDAVDGPFLRKLSNIDAGIARFEKGALSGFGRVEKGISGLMASASRLQVIGGAIGAGFGAQMATQFLDQATSIRNALRGIGQDSDENFNKLYLAATRSMASFPGFASTVRSFYKILGDTQSFDATVRQVETLNKLMALSGKTAQERMSVVLQFGQALQSGVLQGDELRSLRETAPIELLQALSAQLGGTVADLKTFGAEGRINSDVMIAALASLESEADKMMKNVAMTFGDAATAMANGAIVAAEGFDKGLGLSRVGTAALAGLGKVLGENAEAFEMFGKAALAAIAVLGATYLGRRVQDANAALASMYATQTAGVQAAAANAVKVQAAEAAIVAAKQKTVLGIKAKVIALAAEGASQTKVAGANSRLAIAEASLTAARGRFTAATLAAAAAQERLAFSSRAVIAAGALMRGAFAFIGGVPGMILLAGAALLTFGGHAARAAAEIDQLRESTGKVVSLTDDLANTQDRLKESLDAAGTASKVASDKAILGTRAEIAAKRELLALQAEDLKAAEVQRKALIAQKESDLAGYQNTIANASIIGNAFGALDTAIEQSARLKREIAQLRLDSAETAVALARMGDVLQDSKGHAERAEARAAVEKVLTEEVRTRANTYAEELATLTQAATVAAMIAEYGQDSAIVAGQRLAYERETYAAALITKGYTEDQRDALMDAWDAANGIATADIAGMLVAALGPAAEFSRYMREAAAARVVAMQDTPPLTGPAGMGSSPPTGGAVGNSIRPQSKPIDFDFSPDGAGSGGTAGSGGAARDSSMEEALRFVESMLTAEERRAKEMAELVDLRAKLVATYGPEAEIVGRLDEAIQRAQVNMEGLTDQTNEFWSVLSDHIAGSINEWKGWGNFVRGVLSSLVQKWGPDFFQALFMPGQQSGGGFGQVLGNLITGQGAPAASGALARVAQAAPMGKMTSRMGDRMAGAVNMSSVNLKMPEPKARAAGGDTYHFHTSNDFRGVDLSTRQALEAKIDRANAALPGRVIKTIQDAKRARVKL